MLLGRPKHKMSFRLGHQLGKITRDFLYLNINTFNYTCYVMLFN